MPSTRLLRIFLAVAEQGNLTVAAGELGRTQSAVSAQLRKLEESCGVALFERQARGMRLTEDGKRLLPVARRAIAELRRVGDLFGAPLRGRIRIGLPDDYEDSVFEAVLAGFKQRHPEVEVFARSGCTSRFPEAVRRGELDLAVCSGATMPRGAPLAVEPVVWAVGTGFDRDPGDPVPLAILERDCWWRDVPVEALDRAGIAWRVAYASASFASLKSAIRAGLAVGIVTRNNLDSAMVELSVAAGFPALKPAQRALLQSPDAPPDLSSAMADAIREAVR